MQRLKFIPQWADSMQEVLHVTCTGNFSFGILLPGREIYSFYASTGDCAAECFYIEFAENYLRCFFYLKKIHVPKMNFP